MKKLFTPLLIGSLALLATACQGRARHISGSQGDYTGKTDSLNRPEGYGTLQRGTATGYQGQWHKGRPEGWGTWQQGDSCYKGEWKNGLRHGRGKLTLKADSTTYSGYWRKGRREGFGTLTNRQGCTWSGTWHADTLAYGTQTDSRDTYTGQFARNRQQPPRPIPHGFGIYTTADGTGRYEGNWKNGQPAGFGTCMTPREGIQCGHWNSDGFMGERMVYTPTRVYGIDISHYQHGGRPRRRFRGRHIDWKKLRITHLGKNTKNSVGKIDFPVSFCYIKSTQGVKITNPYYRGDARDARKAGIETGAYHFMSPTSGRQQALWFLKNTPISPGDLPPMLDVELSPRQIAAMGGDDAMRREMQTWLDIVEQRTGKRPILYVSQRFINKYMLNAPKRLQSYRFWVARYSEYRPYVKLLYWQLTPFGRVKGIRGDVDINVFNGSTEQFHRYIDSKHTELP